MAATTRQQIAALWLTSGAGTLITLGISVILATVVLLARIHISLVLAAV